MITIENLRFRYPKADSAIFENATADFAACRTWGLIGRNGAGKTTLFDLILGFLAADEGNIHLGISRSDVGFLAQSSMAPSRLKVREVLPFLAACTGDTPKSLIDRFDESLDPQEKEKYERIRDRFFGICSVGERRWLMSSATLLLKRKMFLLDEPTAGVDPESRILIWRRVKRATEQGVVCVVSSHLLDEIAAHTDRFYLVARQSLEDFGDESEFLQRFDAKSMDEAFVKAYSDSLTTPGHSA